MEQYSQRGLSTSMVALSKILNLFKRPIAWLTIEGGWCRSLGHMLQFKWRNETRHLCLKLQTVWVLGCSDILCDTHLITSWLRNAAFTSKVKCPVFVVLYVLTLSCYRTGLDLIKGVVRNNVEAGVIEPSMSKVKIIQVSSWLAPFVDVKWLCTKFQLKMSLFLCTEFRSLPTVMITGYL